MSTAYEAAKQTVLVRHNDDCEPCKAHVNELVKNEMENRCDPVLNGLRPPPSAEADGENPRANMEKFMESGARFAKVWGEAIPESFRPFSVVARRYRRRVTQ
jgi:hypothetical protein